MIHFAEAMCDLVLLIVGQSRLRLLDGGIGTSRREPHDDRIAEPIECRLNVAFLEGTKIESASLKRSFHLDQLLGEGQSALEIEVSRSTRDPRHLKRQRGERQGESL